jgi:hypothetical protein
MYSRFNNADWEFINERAPFSRHQILFVVLATTWVAGAA